MSRICWIVMLCLALTAFGATGRAVRAADSASAALVVHPTDALQTHTFFTPGRAEDCQAIARALGRSGTTPCLLATTVSLRGRGAQRITSGGGLHGKHVQTAYASINICLSSPTWGGTGNCFQTVQGCMPTTGASATECYPSWDARMSAQFQYDGRRVARVWMDTCCFTGLGFVVRETDAFSLPKTNTPGRPLPIGMDVSVTGSIPTTRGVHSRYLVRMLVEPNGVVRFEVR